NGGGEDAGNAVGLDGDQADGLLALQGAEPLAHTCLRPPEAALAKHVDRHEVAVAGLAFLARRNVEEGAELLLVDWLQTSAALVERAVDAKHAGRGLGDDLDDASGVGWPFLRGFLHPQQSPVADAGSALLAAPAEDHED